MFAKYFRFRQWAMALVGLALVMSLAGATNSSPRSTGATTLQSVVWSKFIVDGREVWLGAEDAGAGPVSNKSRVDWLTDRFHQAILVSVGTPKNLRSVIAFGRSPHLWAKIYSVPSSQSGPMNYALNKNGSIVPNPSNLIISVRPRSRNAWIVNGHPNYNLYVNHYLAGAAVEVSEVFGSKGVPGLETTELVTRREHEWNSSQVFAVDKRMSSSPPFVEAPILLKLFPYVGLGSYSKNTIWFTENPPPFTFNPISDTWNLFSFVGFENGGIYAFNSYSYPPKVSFESPFGFYNFDPSSRFSQLVVRDETFPVNDPLSNIPHSIAQSGIEYSWGTNALNQEWQFALQLAGSPPPSKSKVGGITVDAPSSRKLPEWAVGQKWPYVNFVQATPGYPGSEGIYFYGGEMPESVWSWLGGLSSKPPSYTAHPILPATDRLVSSSAEALPTGFRGEYSDTYFADPQLYVARVGDQVNLLGARGGIWNLGGGWTVRYQNLSQGTYIDSWTLTNKTPRKTTPIQELRWIGSLILYSGPNGLQIASNTESPEVGPIPVPTGKNSWEAFVAKEKELPSPNPRELATWIPSGSHVIWETKSAKILRIISSSHRVTIVVRNTLSSQVPNLGRIPAGVSVLTYHRESGDWTIVGRASASRLHAMIKTSAAFVGEPSSLQIRIRNAGAMPFSGTIRLIEDRKMLYSKSVTLLGSRAVSLTVPWSPEREGIVRVTVRNGRHVLGTGKVIARVQGRVALLLRAKAVTFGWTGWVAAVIMALLIGIAAIVWRGGNQVANKR